MHAPSYLATCNYTDSDPISAGRVGRILFDPTRNKERRGENACYVDQAEAYEERHAIQCGQSTVPGAQPQPPSARFFSASSAKPGPLSAGPANFTNKPRRISST